MSNENAYETQLKGQLEQARRTAGGLMAKVQQLSGQLKAKELELKSAEDKLQQRRMADARIRALHAVEYGCCTHCSGLYSQLAPCPTITALNGEPT